MNLKIESVMSSVNTEGGLGVARDINASRDVNIINIAKDLLLHGPFSDMRSTVRNLGMFV